MHKKKHLLIPYEAVRHVGEGVALVFAPHPDDEVFGCGGAIMRHVEAGDPVHVIIVSDGGFQSVMSGVDEMGYVQRRQEESINAGHILGYGTPLFWGLADRDIEYGEKLVRQILSAIDSTGATVVYAPSIFEIHPDHRALGMTAIEAVRRSNKARQIALYEVGTPLRPNVLLDITDLIERKQAAMACFVSQLDIQEYDQHISALNRYRTYTLPKSVKAAEAYLLTSTEELRSNLLGLYDSEFKRQKKLGLAVDTRDSMPLVTVIIRSMGRETLSEALDSVALQTYPNIEVVVVNAKGVGHPEVGEWCGRFPLRLCGSGQALGRSRAANTGLDNAEGEYIIFLDDDDLFDPEHIDDLVKALQKDQDACVAYSGVRCTYEQAGTSENRMHVLNEPFSVSRLYSRNYIPIHAVMFERTMLDHGCRFHEELEVCEDWEFWLQLSRISKFIHQDRISATYRCSGTSGVGPGPALVDDMQVRNARERIFNKWKLIWSGEDINAILAEKDSQWTEQRGSSQEQIVMREGDIVPLKRELDRMKAEIARLREYEE